MRGGQDFSTQVWGGKNIVRDYRGGGTFWVQAIFGISPATPAVNNDHPYYAIPGSFTGQTWAVRNILSFNSQGLVDCGVCLYSLREISLTMGAGGLINWANFPPSFPGAQTDDAPYSAGLKFVDPLTHPRIMHVSVTREKTQFDSELLIKSHKRESVRHSCGNSELMILHHTNFMIPLWWWFLDPPPHKWDLELSDPP